MIREAYRAQCEICGHDLDTHEDGVHQWTAGWVMNRKRGGHGISCAVRSPRWAHHHCVVNAVAGLERQSALFK
jgi:hypothetical protein